MAAHRIRLSQQRPVPMLQTPHRDRENEKVPQPGQRHRAGTPKAPSRRHTHILSGLLGPMPHRKDDSEPGADEDVPTNAPAGHDARRPGLLSRTLRPSRNPLRTGWAKLATSPPNGNAGKARAAARTRETRHNPTPQGKRRRTCQESPESPLPQ